MKLRLLALCIIIGGVTISAQQGEPLSGPVFRAITDAGVPIVSVSIGVNGADPTDKTAWKVQPENLQSAAQPVIDAFDPNEPARLMAERDAQTDALLDVIADDLLTAILENFKALSDEANAGTLPGNISAWTQQLHARVKAIRRAK